jgi:hypothetical protein
MRVVAWQCMVLLRMLLAVVRMVLRKVGVHMGGIAYHQVAESRDLSHAVRPIPPARTTTVATRPIVVIWLLAIGLLTHRGNVMQVRRCRRGPVLCVICTFSNYYNNRTGGCLVTDDHDGVTISTE